MYSDGLEYNKKLQTKHQKLINRPNKNVITIFPNNKVFCRSQSSNGDEYFLIHVHYIEIVHFYR